MRDHTRICCRQGRFSTLVVYVLIVLIFQLTILTALGIKLMKDLTIKLDSLIRRFKLTKALSKFANFTITTNKKTIDI